MMRQRTIGKVRLLAALLVFIVTLFFIALPGPATGIYAQSDYVLGVVDSTIIGGSGIALTLENTSGGPITLTGPLDVAATVFYGYQDLVFPRETIIHGTAGDTVFNGAIDLLIADGSTEIIAELAPGLPDTWRSHDSADHVLSIMVYLKINGVDYNLSAVHVTIEPSGFDPGLVMHTNSPVAWPGQGTENMVISLENTSTDPVTISGPLVAQGEGVQNTVDRYESWSLDYGRERERFSLAGGSEITILPGATVVVAEIEPGPPLGWRNFYSPRLLLLTAWVMVTESADGSGVWQSAVSPYAIIGEVIDPGAEGVVTAITDNEDGTASIAVEVYQAQYGYIVYEDSGHYFMDDSYEIFQDQPIIGMQKGNFSISQQTAGGRQVFPGELISVRKAEDPGTYILIWAAPDGTYKNIVLEGSDPENDYYYMLSDGPDHLTVTVSTLNRKVESVINPDTGKYEGTLTYSSVNISFVSDQPIDAEINLRQKGSTARPLPTDGPVPAGLYYDINLASGDLTGVSILLEISYSRDDIPAGMNENDLKLFRFNEDTSVWDFLPDQEIDIERQIIRVWLDGFSEFAVFEYDADEAVDGDDDADDSEPISQDPGDEERIPIPETGSTDNAKPAFLLLMAILGLALLSRRSRRT